MAKDFLFELGLEEMPAHVVTPSMNQLKEKMAEKLAEARLSFASIDCFSTPRRLAVRVNQLIEGQESIEEEMKGPALKIAKDEDGNWTRAAEGFARGQQLTTDDLYIKELKGVEYVYLTKKIAGQKTKDLLPNILKEVIESLTFPTMMRWRELNFKFIRPIHWFVALYDTEIIPFEFLNIGATNVSRGHRFLGREVIISQPKNYEMELLTQYVMVDPMMRKTRIMEQMVDFGTNNQWKIDFDEALLEEVNNLVEYPTAFVGMFDEKYLAIPEEVLITSMKEHQRYFDVRDVDGHLLPCFISVRNGDLEHIENVIAGNEKVLTARLEDAEFFYQEDQKTTIAENVAKLSHVMFHEKIGTMQAKMERVAKIATHLADLWQVDAKVKEAVMRASDIYKFDLVTGMVDEFPELQGVMGEKYALLQGETKEVATAIREHYLPTSTEGALPETMAGMILSVADKWDSLMSFFTAGLIPTGSNDPYALRRQAYGLVRMIHDFALPFDIVKEQTWAEKNVTSEDGFHYHYDHELLTDFMAQRMKQLLARNDIRYDVIEAVIQSDNNDVEKQLLSANVLACHLEDEDFKETTENFNRVANLASKLSEACTIDEALFENEAEKALYQAMKAIVFTDNVEANYQSLKQLAPMIATYFDQTMIMVEDEAMKQNRLSLLKTLDQMVKQVANTQALVIK